MIVSTVTDTEAQDRLRGLVPVGRGAYSVVYHLTDSTVVKSFTDDVFDAFLCEIAAYQRLNELAPIARACEVPLTIIQPTRFSVIRYEHPDDSSIRGAVPLAALMEMPAGLPLNDSRVMPMNDLRKLALDMMVALELMRIAGILHRDIKPQNMLVFSDASRGNHYRLCDFGIARFVGQDTLFADLDEEDDAAEGAVALIDDSRSSNGLTAEMYTSSYRPPELNTREECTEYSFPADMWALGMSLIHLANGKAFKDARSRDEIRARHAEMAAAEREALPVREYGILGADPDAVALIRAMMAADPAQRIQPAQAVLHPFFEPLVPMAKRLALFDDLFKTRDAWNQSERAWLLKQPAPNWFACVELDETWIERVLRYIGRMYVRSLALRQVLSILQIVHRAVVSWPATFELPLTKATFAGIVSCATMMVICIEDSSLYYGEEVDLIYKKVLMGPGHHLSIKTWQSISAFVLSSCAGRLINDFGAPPPAAPETVEWIRGHIRAGTVCRHPPSATAVVLRAKRESGWHGIEREEGVLNSAERLRQVGDAAEAMGVTLWRQAAFLHTCARISAGLENITKRGDNADAAI